MALSYLNAEHSVIWDDSQRMSIPCVVGNTQFDEIEEAGTAIADYVARPETWGSVREKRNKLLKDTDWQGMSDVTMSDAETTYRQALRDLPSTNSDPASLVWPTAPGV